MGNFAELRTRALRNAWAVPGGDDMSTDFTRWLSRNIAVGLSVNK